MHAETAFVLDGDTPDTETTSSHRDRDPRTKPEPGDVLAVGNDVREVWDVIALHGSRALSSVQYGFPGKAATRFLRLDMWRVWARNAEVRKVAP